MEIVVECPNCGESIDLVIDEGGGASQRYVEDCEVCCRPMSIDVQLEDGDCSVSVRNVDD